MCRAVAVGFGLAIGMAGHAAAWADMQWYVSVSGGGYFREPESGATTYFRDVFLPVTPPPVGPTPVASAPGEIVVPARRLPLAGPPVVTRLTAPGTFRFAYDPGWTGTLALGRRITPRLRLEGEIGVTVFSAGTDHPFTTSSNFPNLRGETYWRHSGLQYSRTTETVNVFYDLKPIAGRFTPYLGTGVGASNGHKSAGVYVNSGGHTLSYAASASVQPVALAEGGINIALTPRLSLAPAYRYVRDLGSGGDIAHVAKLGLRFAF